MYRIHAVILYKQVIRDRQIRIVLFSREYGKITAWGKSAEMIGDIGSIVEVLIERTNSNNTIKQLSIMHNTSLLDWKYCEVIEYLQLFSILYDTLPDGSEHTQLYDDVQYFIKNIDCCVGKVGQLLIMQARILKKLGYLDPQHFGNSPNLEILYIQIFSRSMKSMLSDFTCNEVQSSAIKISILNARYSYQFRM